MKRKETRLSIERRYLMDMDDVVELLEIQEGRCLMCERFLYETGYHVDHDHNCCPTRNTCGKCVRALLCPDCNQALGFYERHAKQCEEYLALFK